MRAQGSGLTQNWRERRIPLSRRARSRPPPQGSANAEGPTVFVLVRARVRARALWGWRPEMLKELAAACADAAVPQTGLLPGAYRRTALPLLERQLTKRRTRAQRRSRRP